MRLPLWFRRLKRRNNYTLPQRITVRRFIPARRMVFGAVAIALFLGVLFFVVTGDMFFVKEIIISPQSEMYVARSEIGIIAQTHVPTSIFMFPGNQLEREIVSRYPQVRDVTVSRQLPSTVEISYTEYVPALCIRTSDTWFIVSDDGMVFYSYENVETIPEDVPLVSIGDTQVLSQLSVGEYVQTGTIEWLLATATFNWTSLGLNLSEVVMEVPGETTRVLQVLYLNTDNRLVIKLKRDQDPTEILQLVEPILTSSLRSGKTVIELDLRFDRPVVRYS